MKFFQPLVILGILLLLVACGKRGPVRPLEAHLPKTVKNVGLMQIGDELLLSWQLPSSNQDGTPLESPPVIDIYRMLFDPNDNCPECTDRSTLLHSIDPELPHPAHQKGDRYLFYDRQVSAGQGYHYRLVPVDKSGRPGQSLVKRVAFLGPHAAPEGLQVTPHDRSTVLTWTPLQPREGMVLLGYHVFRRSGDSGNSLLRLTKRAVTETTFNDYKLNNGTEYNYHLRALLQQGGLSLETLPSAIVSATPHPDS